LNIYVGNLSFDTTERELEATFAHFGAVSTARIATDRDTGRARGFGFIEMPDATEAQAAIAAMNGKELQGRTLTVNEARPHEERGGGNRSSGYGGGSRSGGYGSGSRNRW
jgi:RNA recognition motif-containing protein